MAPTCSHVAPYLTQYSWAPLPKIWAAKGPLPIPTMSEVIWRVLSRGGARSSKTLARDPGAI
jgi:hypothetical protein